MTTKRIHFFQHVPFEGPGIIQNWAGSCGHTISTTSFFSGQNPPDPDQFDWLVVMGGPMGVHDEIDYPWLKIEKRAIEAAIGASKVVLGICLGAQLIADVLGAEVRPNAYKEIGWFPIYLSNEILDHPVAELFPPQWISFHWHGDTFGLPNGARLIASSVGCRNQGFIYSDRVIGLQFHMEMTERRVHSLLQNCRQELTDSMFIQSESEILNADAPYHQNHQLMNRLLDYLDTLS
jgi:GMP synthase-like glutamine amidotransferase